MGLIRWFTTNAADTDAGTHEDLAPLELEQPPDEAFQHLVALIPELPRWRVESCDATGRTIMATHRTGLWRFVDDVTIRVTETGERSTVHARSKSRLGKGDFGQNRRNILGLFAALRSRARSEERAE